MKWMKSLKGNDVLVLNEHTYMSFGKDVDVKWIHLSYLDESGVRRGHLLPVTLNKIKREYSSKIGKKNLISLRTFIRDRVDGEILPRNKVDEIREFINIKSKSN